MELQHKLGELAEWTGKPDRPFPGDAVALGDQLHRVAELLQGSDDLS